MAAEKLPGSPTSPYDIIKSKFNDTRYLLGRQFEQDERALQSQGLSKQQYQAKNSELNRHYLKLLEQQTFEHRSKVQNLDELKSSVGRGEITDQAAYRAGWKMVLPSETFNARFPTLSKGQQVKPMAPATLRSHSEMMGQFASGAEEKKGWEWGDPYRTQAGLVSKYQDWRAQVGYDQLPPAHQNQLDLQWDAVMRGDKKFKDWFSDKGKTKPNEDVKALRMKGKIGRAMAEKLVPRRYGSGRPGSVTPIGNSFIKYAEKKANKKRQPVTDTNAPTAAELKRAGTEEAYNKGVTLGYWR